jgi:DNA-binding NarL/FixJ family response regulator
MSGPARQPLTRHQAAVLTAAADGAPLTEVALRLGRPRSWVAARLSEAYKRLDVAWMDRDERRAAAVRLARKRGLIPPASSSQGSRKPENAA